LIDDEIFKLFGLKGGEGGGRRLVGSRKIADIPSEAYFQ